MQQKHKNTTNWPWDQIESEDFLNLNHLFINKSIFVQFGWSLKMEGQQSSVFNSKVEAEVVFRELKQVVFSAESSSGSEVLEVTDRVLLN